MANTYMVDKLIELLNIPSPSGYTEKAIQFLEKELDLLGIKYHRTKKGALVWQIEGKESEKKITFGAHIDTLGAMIKTIKPNGRLTLHQIGGWDWATVEGNTVQIHTENQIYTGTVVNIFQSIHINANLRGLKREQNNIEVRIDEKTSSYRETKDLGIKVGDFVTFDANPEVTRSGYIKSRHIDNKASVAIFLECTKQLLKEAPKHTTEFIVTTFEEVGHGGSTIETDEFIVVDMAAVGGNQLSDEHKCSLCVADGFSPYSFDLNKKIEKIALNNDINLIIDIYPYYASDGSAAWRAGRDFPIALIGPGVDASHSYERTHTDALNETCKLIIKYVNS